MSRDKNVSRDTIIYIPLDKIKANPHQHRKTFDAVKLQELSDSIKVHGVQQPITVSPPDTEGFYTLIAGERRTRAARLASLTEIPAIIKHGDPAVLALVENLQRVDISPIEEAQGYQDLIDRGETHESIAALVGKTRSYISQKIRLLKLPDVIKIAMESDYYGNGVLSEGGARQLMRLKLLDKISTRTFNVRGSHMADCSDTIINSPLRLRSVSAIKGQVDWIISLLLSIEELEPVNDKEQWINSLLECIKSGEAFSYFTQQQIMYEKLKPDVSLLSDNDRDEIFKALETVISESESAHSDDVGERVSNEGESD